ncbi:MerR family transcriptional regulator [Undibacterium cyanobacteriorum]|uniref:MerR family transcriptional regulator n=1 Tax=Undibacterium cyanobacteriorum TaxID=3073561 RepID=A0ABY9RG76_9BURK|nr:MerR family transcriptional regulator [Undibacterium sp. 20NA77.5]WMW79635.1 MerR family transcriptional regulator [Undibacterium sp. 20NA77.5]
MQLKIGDLAKRTGITVRTLHHYDKLGLLTPSVRSDAGYRLYDRNDIARLHRIQALRRLDLSLQEVAEIVDTQGVDLNVVIDEQIRNIEHHIKQQEELLTRLRELQNKMHDNSGPSLDYWLSTLEMMSVQDKYLNKADLDFLRQQPKMRSGELDRVLQSYAAQIRSLIQAKVPPEDHAALEIAKQWMKTVNTAIPHPGVLKKIVKLHEQEPAIQAMSGVDQEVMNYLNQSAVEIRYQFYRSFLSEEECQYMRPAFIRNADRWLALFADLQALIDQGVAASDERTQERLVEWREMFFEAWGHNLEVIQKVRLHHQKEPPTTFGGGLTQEILNYALTGLYFMETQRHLEGQPTSKSAKRKR